MPVTLEVCPSEDRRYFIFFLCFFFNRVVYEDPFHVVYEDIPGKLPLHTRGGTHLLLLGLCKVVLLHLAYHDHLGSPTFLSVYIVDKNSLV